MIRPEIMERFKKIIIGFLVFLSLFAVTGFFIVPPLVKSILIQKLSETLHRNVTIEAIKFNPFRGCLTIRGVVIGEPAQEETFVSFREFFINIEGISILKRAIIVSECNLRDPRMHLVRRADGTYNFSDLLQKEKSREEEESTPLQFSVNNIRITDGKIIFQDVPGEARHIAEKIQIEIPFISNISHHADTFVEPYFRAVINGATHVLEGYTKPFKNTYQTELSIKINKIDLPHYMTYLSVKPNFLVPSAFLDVDMKLVFRQETSGQQFLGLEGQVTLNDLAVDDVAGGALLRLPLLQATLAELAPLSGKYHLSELTLVAPELHARRNRQGEVNLSGLFPDEKESSMEATDTAETGQGGQVVVDIDTFQIRNGTISFEDYKPASPVRLSLSDLQLSVLDLSTSEKKEGKATFSASLPNQGSLSLEGPIVLSPLSAKLALDVRQVDVPLFQPYIGDMLNVRVTGGKVGAQGDFTLREADGELKTGYRGKASLTRFAAIDTRSANDLLKWRSLYLNGVDFAHAPLRFHVHDVALTDFYSRIFVRQDATLNLQHLGREDRRKEQKTRSIEIEQHDGASNVQEEGKCEDDIHIGSLTLQGGEIDFMDTSITPKYSQKLTGINGRISDLSSLGSAGGDVELRGKVDGYAPLEITGRINPLKRDLYVDLKAVFTGMDLSPVTPYSGKYIGYEIQKGKLSFDLKYQIEKRKLDSTNLLFLDQFNLGERVDSPDATDLPVALAVSLLKDRHGQIKLDIPVSGSLDDPEFSVWRIILKVVKNLLTKAATAPFSLLGSLFGGGEELSYIEFDPGLAHLNMESLKKIELLSKALADRPALKLDLEGYVDMERDREAMRRMTFDRKLKAQKMNDLNRSGKAATILEEVTMEQDEYEKYLRKAYESERFSKPRNLIGLTKRLPVPEMEKLMYDHIEIKDGDLRQLANQRVSNTRDAILSTGEVETDRIFMVETRYQAPPEKEKTRKSRVEFRLK
ncbi:MAG: DUF748 domain-containing protein [Syntrophales bacterium]|nr:DUF748 domain-containing protein [Syntrophales bacterium]